MSSSTTDVTPNEQESQDQAVPSYNVETSKLASIRPDTSEAESLVSPGLALMVDQLPTSDRTIPNKSSYTSDVTPVRDASVRLQGCVDNKILVDSASYEAQPNSETTGMDQVKTLILYCI